MQKPSVGRIVHYHGIDGPPRAAIVTATCPENDPELTVDICILCPSSMFFNRAVKFSEEPKPGCWTWPPRV